MKKKLKIKYPCWFVLGVIDALLSFLILILCIRDNRPEKIFDVVIMMFFSVFFFMRSSPLNK